MDYVQIMNKYKLKVVQVSSDGSIFFGHKTCSSTKFYSFSTADFRNLPATSRNRIKNFQITNDSASYKKKYFTE